MPSRKRKPLVYIHRLEWNPYEYYMNEENEKLLQSFAEVRNDGNVREPMTHEALVERLRGVEAILSLNGSRAPEITREVLEEVGTVRVAAVSHWWGDLSAKAAEAWRQAGVEVIDASDACNQAVGEWALGAIIAGLRRFDEFDRRMKSGEKWPSWRGVAGQLNGATVGLVAVGRTGRWLLRYLKPFDCRVIAYDPYMKKKEAKELGIELVDLPTLLRTADAISLHAPVTPETTGMIGRKELAMIRDGALLVNSARAALLDNDAFRDEMKKGRFRAYIDVFQPEPPPEDDVLRTLNNIVMTPHVAGTTDAMYHRCGQMAIQAIRDYLERA